MPEVRIIIGGREFDVICQDGEEAYLQGAAAMLDAEAQVLLGQIGRMPEARLLLMAGLMLADKTQALEERLRAAEERAERAEAAVAAARANPARVEVPVIPAIVADTLAEIAARAEALAEEIDSAPRPETAPQPALQPTDPALS
ncbi:cell division protein ZapA [Phaeovulum vinaykumarii]|uniref:Cell division protein ZapA n=1 Tax=Phaeovulum vinaykumarii TaxID=407234 RepID=A0A1N7LWT4_9RHOB|nr:cell division protein ZapA [Phaeovulum vinaykumarii]SIS78315.1 cell division protein ZapA [Phaeovulum vinaykumarii]SOC07081.1 cell division protein ZapA [Phaeovulum vinaykumarii]